MQTLVRNCARQALPVSDSWLRIGTNAFLRSKHTASISSVFLGRCYQHDREVTLSLLNFDKCAKYKQSGWNSRIFSTYSVLQAGAKDKEQLDKSENTGADSANDNEPEQLTVFQRFKKTYKEHGKVLVGVHVLTSSVWFGTFFYAASVGVDVVPLMEWLGFSDKIINPFRNSSAGNVAVAYLMYKLATPARYTVTLAGTNFMVKYLRKTGKMQPKQATESLRSLAKDSQAEFKEKTVKLRSEMNKRQSKVRKILNSKVKERQSRLKIRQIALHMKSKEGRKTLLREFRLKRKVVTAKMKSRLRRRRNKK